MTFLTAIRYTSSFIKLESPLLGGDLGVGSSLIFSNPIPYNPQTTMYILLHIHYNNTSDKVPLFLNRLATSFDLVL